jgi:hypothetical protein
MSGRRLSDMSQADFLQQRAETIRQLRENPHTEWVLDLFDWTNLPLLLIGLVPCLVRVWKKNRIRSGILTIWFVFILWYIWGCVIAPYIAVKWTGDRRVWFYFPEGPAVPAIAFGGWLPAILLSSLTWLARHLYFRIIRLGIDADRAH